MKEEIIEIIENVQSEDPIKQMAINSIKGSYKEFGEADVEFFLNLVRLLAEKERFQVKAEILDAKMEEELRGKLEDAGMDAMASEFIEAVNPPQLG